MSRTHEQANMTFRSVMCDAVAAERKAGGVATDLFRLARKCDDLDEFLGRCAFEEEWVVSDEAGASKWHDVPRCWVQAKSDIKQSMRAGVDLRGVTSYSKMKAKKIELSKKDKEAKAEAKVTDSKPERKDSPAGETTSPSVIPLPKELVEMVKYLNELPEISRAKLIKDFTKQAKTAHDMYKQGLAHAARQKAANA